MMNRFRHSRFVLNLSLIATASCLLLTEGCQERRPTDELAQAVNMGERPVAMKGAHAFFSDKLVATITISRGIGKGRKAATIKADADASKNPKSSGTKDTAFLGGGDGIGGGASPEDGNTRRGMFSALRGGNSGDGRQQMADISGMENDEAMAYLRAKAAVGSPMPPVTIHFTLQNTSTSTITVSIMDFNSDLGNFAIHPDVLKIAPGETISPDPMISQLGITSDEIPVQVRLKIGSKSETQTIVIKNLLATSNSESLAK
jgi:hypothetical protein